MKENTNGLCLIASNESVICLMFIKAYTYIYMYIYIHFLLPIALILSLYK